MIKRRTKAGQEDAAAADVRSITLAFVLATLATGAGFCAASQSAWRVSVKPWLDAQGPTTEVALAVESWPICSSMKQIGTDVDWGQLDPDFAAGKRALVVQDWNGAIASLKLASLRDPSNADIQNYVGYAYHRLHQMGPAMQHYQSALILNRRHRGAHGHLGELYLALGEAAKAEEELAILGEICLIPCEEYGSLERAIATYKKQVTR